MSTINVDTTVTTVNILTTGQQGPSGPQGPIGPTGEVDPVVIAYLQGLIDGLNESKLDKIDYVQHFRGLHNSYAELVASIPVGNDGDYAHIKASQNFPRLEAIWSGTPGVWNITSANIGINTDAVPEGNTNLYFTSSRAQQAALLALLTGLDTSIATSVVATDNIKQAIGKLQAQHNSNWINGSTIGVYGTMVKTGEIQFRKKNGNIYMRGAIELQVPWSAQQSLFRFTDNSWGIKRYNNIDRIGRYTNLFRSSLQVTYDYYYEIVGTYYELRMQTAVNASSTTYNGFWIIPETCLGEAP